MVLTNVPTGLPLLDPTAIHQGMAFVDPLGRTRVVVGHRIYPAQGAESAMGLNPLAFIWSTNVEEFHQIDLRAVSIATDAPLWTFVGCHPSVASADDVATYGAVDPPTPGAPGTDPTDLARLLEAAEYHAVVSAEGDHQVGDLEDVLRSCWRLLTPEQRAAVMDEHSELLDTFAPTDEQIAGENAKESAEESAAFT